MTVQCTYCEWQGNIEELDSEENRLEKWSKCPECGSSSKSDYLLVDGIVP